MRVGEVRKSECGIVRLREERERERERKRERKSLLAKYVAASLSSFPWGKLDAVASAYL